MVDKQELQREYVDGEPISGVKAGGQQTNSEFVEGGNEEAAGIIVTLIVNIVNYALQVFQKTFPYPATFVAEINLAMQIIVLFTPIIALLALVQGLRRKGIVYFFGAAVIGIIFVYAKVANPWEFGVDIAAMMIILILKYKKVI
jgi:hypothetical protein